MYRAPIRPLLQYGAIALDSTEAVHKYQLDVIRRKPYLLRVKLWASRPLRAALLIETDEKPLQLAREQLKIKYALKVKVPDNHVARAMLEDLWTVWRAKSNNKFGENNRSLQSQMHANILQIYGLECIARYIDHKRV